ncbi:TRAP transporter large permease [Anaerotruncus sp. AF02-27]|uniref:TRAP transporter large permease n=1 Tax=Anaerotruncus sp. AF02-27 TaxID=2292191 RepID=UPI000E4D37B7|nr:TRAP transporter large permease [Anaerotruncus sp. AF02-27]RGX55521.1 TRAP transporter large permease [Anaerotruncus sp. AF02-27]
MGVSLVGLFILLLIMGLPIAYVLVAVAVAGIMAMGTVPLITVVQRMFSGLNSFTLLAVPLFIMAANLMNRGQISNKLIDFCCALVGHIKGGLGYANVLVSMLFAGISGSSQADTAGIGKILIPGMIEEGFSEETSVGVTAASSTIGIIIPPSIPMVVYSSVANASIGELFLGGVIPGILIGLGQMAVVFIASKIHNYPCRPRVPLKEIARQAFINLPSLVAPVIIVGGVLAGVCTATEAACIACLYAGILGIFVFRTIHPRDIAEIFMESAKTSAISLFALASANALGQLLGYYKVSTIIAAFFENGIVNNRFMFMFMVFLFFLFLGTFMDANPAMILFVPMLLPIGETFGVTPVQMGIVIVITLAVGQVTPPYGLCLLIASDIAHMPIHRAFKAVLPYIAVTASVAVLLAFFPDIAFAVPRLIKPDWSF